MPIYRKDFEWQDLAVSGNPAGIQSIPWLGWLLKRWTVYTGSRRPFSIHIRAKTLKRRQSTVTLEWFCTGPGGGSMSEERKTQTCSLRKTAKVGVQPNQMMSSGEGHVRLFQLSLDSGETWGYGHSQPGFEDLISYDVLSYDSLMDKILFLVVTLVAAATIGGLSALLGAWAGTKLFQGDQPISVVIVEELPTPALQSETDNNEP